MSIIKKLRRLFPHGHPDFVKLSVLEMGLHSRKNKDYARGGDPLGNFKRVSAIKRLYPGLDWASPTGVAIGNMLKQLDAGLWMLAQAFEGETEGFDSRMADVGVYTKIIRILKEVKC